jgi:hypothetical protein
MRVFTHLPIVCVVGRRSPLDANIHQINVNSVRGISRRTKCPTDARFD